MRHRRDSGSRPGVAQDRAPQCRAASSPGGGGDDGNALWIHARWCRRRRAALRHARHGALRRERRELSDRTALEGFLILVATISLVVFLIVDLINMSIDPRRRPGLAKDGAS